MLCFSPDLCGILVWFRIDRDRRKRKWTIYCLTTKFSWKIVNEHLQNIMNGKMIDTENLPERIVGTRYGANIVGVVQFTWLYVFFKVETQLGKE